MEKRRKHIKILFYKDAADATVSVEQGDGIAETSFQAPAPEPAPQHEVGEEEVPGSWPDLPKHAPAVRDQQRNEEPDGKKRHEARDHAGDRNAPDEGRRDGRDRCGRCDGVR